LARIVKVIEKNALVMSYAVSVCGDLLAMNKPLLSFFLGAISLGFLPGAMASNRWETLRAINLVENPTNQTHVGSRGELGPYQFRVSTWQMHTQKPFNMATDRSTADEVAISHYEWIKRGLDGAGIDPNAYNIAMAWNCGLSAVVGGRIPAESYRYAEQVNNLVQLFKERARAEEVAAAAAVAVAPAKPAPSEFQVEFDPAATRPHFLLQTDADVPLLVVSTEAPRFVISAAPTFSVATAD
jgi:hypothetical protein